MGYSPIGSERSASPFAEFFPATKRLHGHPEVRVMVLSRGDALEMVVVRVDVVLVVQELRRAILDEVETRTGRNLEDSLVLAATHSHSGPGRILDRGGLFDIVADRYHAEFTRNLVRRIAETIEVAYRDLSPAKLATAVLDAPGAHGDRRCEDGQDDPMDRRNHGSQAVDCHFHKREDA